MYMYVHVHTALNECKTLKGGRYVCAHHFRGFVSGPMLNRIFWQKKKKQLPEVEQPSLITYRDKNTPQQ